MYSDIDGLKETVRKTDWKVLLGHDDPLFQNIVDVDKLLDIIEIAFDFGQEEGFDDGRKKGWKDQNPEYVVDRLDRAYEEGYEDGKEEGYADGFDHGREEGYADGLDHGREEGYDDGYTVGYDRGYEEARLEYGE